MNEGGIVLAFVDQIDSVYRSRKGICKISYSEKICGCIFL